MNTDVTLASTAIGADELFGVEGAPGTKAIKNAGSKFADWWKNIEGAGEASEGQFKIDPKRTGHIFRDSEGHFKADTTQNRAIIEGVTNEKNYLGPDSNGNEWYAQTNPDGTQTWAQVRNGKIINGGINQIPKTYSSTSGLSNPAKPTQK